MRIHIKTPSVKIFEKTELPAESRIGFSKKIECLINRMVLYCTHFNFCREHAGLTDQDGRDVKCKNTPAREAGITESKWKLRDLLTFRPFKTSTG
jgi:hypothetical protein